MSYDVYWVKNRAEKIADFEHPTRRGTDAYSRSRFAEPREGEVMLIPQLRCFAACSGFLMDACPLGTRR